MRLLQNCWQFLRIKVSLIINSNLRDCLNGLFSQLASSSTPDADMWRTMLISSFISVIILLSAAATPVVRKKRGSLATLAQHANSDSWISPTALSNVERREFLAEHNRWRSLVQPTAGDMLKMVSLHHAVILYSYVNRFRFSYPRRMYAQTW